MKTLRSLLEKYKSSTSFCKVCFKELPINNKNVSICGNCFSKFESIYKKESINRVNYFYIYRYNEFIRSLIYQFKGCYDIELSKCFLERQRIMLKILYHDYLVIPIPSWKDDDNKRGFNHVFEIFSSLNLKMCPCLHKKENIKQSSLNKEQRLKTKNLSIDKVNLTNKKILIVDDVMTTGSTVKHAIEIIKKKKPKIIKVLILAKNCRTNKK